MESSLDKEKRILDAMWENCADIDHANAIIRTRRVHVTIPEAQFMDALTFLKEKMDFDHLITITGLDTGEHFEFIYHVSEPSGVVVSLKFETARGDGIRIASVLPIYNGATFYEREVSGLLGVTIDGLPEGRQYPLPDNWPEGEYPMRKDWKPGPRAFNPIPPAQMGIPVPEGKGETK